MNCAFQIDQMVSIPDDSSIYQVVMVDLRNDEPYYWLKRIFPPDKKITVAAESELRVTAPQQIGWVMFVNYYEKAATTRRKWPLDGEGE